MHITRFLGALAIAALTLSTVSAQAASKMSGGSHMAAVPSDVNLNMNSRFGGPGVYTGAPVLGATLAVVVAGGGPKNYSTMTLLKTLAGDKTDAEVAKLSKTYGKPAVGQFVKTFDFIISDALHYVTVKHIELPSQPAVDPKDGEKLAGALWGATSIGGGNHNVEVGLDHLVGHPLHMQIMKDIDAKYGVAADAQYHVILLTALTDLANVYHLDANGMMKAM
ncbi:MAG: hypothetical protein JO233_09915 [Candidatus Eremiobacteraeota bacterium]|nr:hypothetical protein [Candidatus Eremiobacteraeota bacterium]